MRPRQSSQFMKELANRTPEVATEKDTSEGEYYSSVSEDMMNLLIWSRLDRPKDYELDKSNSTDNCYFRDCI